MPDFSHRHDIPELMDDFAITDARLTDALAQLRLVNRYLGGYAGTLGALAPLLRAEPDAQILDVGTGGGDFPAYLAEHTRAHVTGLDANPVTLDYARRVGIADLSAEQRARVRFAEGDALALPFDDDAFDVAVTSLFLHHFSGEEAAQVLREMARVSRYGIIVSDLHRHPLAYYGILGLTKLLPVSPMFAHDAPVSVLRGFDESELVDVAKQAELEVVQVRWRWAFRWVMTARKR